MINNKKNKSNRTLSQRLVQIMKNIKTKDVTIQQLEQTIIKMKQNSKRELCTTSISKQFWENVWEQNQK